MLTDLRAGSSLRGERIDLEFTWVGDPQTRPALRLLRQRRAYPATVGDGTQVLDVESLFGSSALCCAAIRRFVDLGHNMLLESGDRRAELVTYGPTFELKHTKRLQILLLDADSHEILREEITDVKRIERTERPAAGWQREERFDIWVSGGPGNPDVLAAQLQVQEAHEDGVSADRLVWSPVAVPPVSVSFEHLRRQRTDISLWEAYDIDSGDSKRRFEVADRDLDPETVYYYRLFQRYAAGPESFTCNRNWQVAATATGRHGLSGALYSKLPALHRFYDEPEPEDRNRGELRCFLEVFGAALDQIRGFAEALQDRHVVSDVHADRLLPLARFIGWEPDQTLDARLLRNDIHQAPEIYRTLGTVPNIRAMVNRVTGWDCEVKEFAHNVLLSNAPETPEVWEIWERRLDGGVWGDTVSLTRTDTVDGHAVQGSDAAGREWLCWHGDRDGERHLWLRRYADDDSQAYRAALFEVPLHRESRSLDESPVLLSESDGLRLFYASNYGGEWNIWSSKDSGDWPFLGMQDPRAPEVRQPATVAENLTAHPSDDRHPAVARGAAGETFLFWQSDRRGPNDIWMREGIPGPSGTLAWGVPERVTTAEIQDRSPAAAIEGNRLWLLWSADNGDRSNIYCRVRSGGTWGPTTPVSTGSGRAESPAAAVIDTTVWIFWSALKGERWQIKCQAWHWDGNAPAPSGAVATVSDHLAHCKEPVASVDSAGVLRLTWRSQQRGLGYRSRTVDFDDAEMVARLGTFRDRAHYSYDTGTSDSDWYARNCVGIFLRPSEDAPDLYERSRRLLEGPLRHFLPIHVRAALIIEPPVHKELVYTYDFPTVAPQIRMRDSVERDTTAVHREVYDGPAEGVHSDTIPTWIWLRSWLPGQTADDPLLGRSVVPVALGQTDLHFRTWHTGVHSGG